MSTLYLFGLIGVAAIMLAVTWEAVRSVSRRRDEWQDAIEALSESRLMVDRREVDLPYVGQQRRQPVRPTQVPGVQRLPGREAGTGRRAA